MLTASAFWTRGMISSSFVDKSCFVRSLFNSASSTVKHGLGYEYTDTNTDTRTQSERET